MPCMDIFKVEEDELYQTWGQFNFRIRTVYLKKMELELITLELKFHTKTNSPINLPFNFFNSEICLP